MIRIKHSQVGEIVRVAEGDFCFVTEHTRNNTDVRWAYSLKLGDYGGAEQFNPTYSTSREFAFSQSRWAQGATACSLQ